MKAMELAVAQEDGWRSINSAHNPIRTPSGRRGFGRSAYAIWPSTQPSTSCRREGLSRCAYRKRTRRTPLRVKPI